MQKLQVWAPFDNLDTEDSYVDKAIRATEIEGSSVEEAFREILLSDDISSEQVVITSDFEWWSTSYGVCSIGSQGA